MRLKSVFRRARPFLRTVRMAFRSRAVILLYHRVAAPQADPLLLCASPAHFEQHLALIQKEYTPLSLADLAAAHAAGRIPDRAVVITFDDGYADNLHAAAPILRRYGARATVFVAGACLEGKPFFYDEMEEILLLAPRLPRTLRITIDGAARAWDLADWARLPKTADETYWKWNLESASDPTPRHRCYRELFGLLRGASAATRSRAIAALRKAAAIGAASPGAKRWMTRAEIRRAAKEGTLEFGAHTRNHPALNKLAIEDQREEIVSGKRMLESAAGMPVRAFAYPYGSPWDVSPTTLRLAREAGFCAACANTPAPVDSESDLFWLPRCLVRDWDGEEFARRLSAFFEPRADIPPQG
ncbi:MAG: polysaccharide deacetylase family protein [Anaerolineales bacterium]|nr:polysaccharide deacetylase family protein [Anaerolineales bacterium]